MKGSSFIFVLLAGSCLGLAQDSPSVPSQPPAENPAVAVISGPRVVLPAGTRVRLRTTAPLSSKRGKPGDPVPLEVMRDVKVGDLLAVAKHTPVEAKLAQVRHAGHALRNGSLLIEVKSVDAVNGDAVPVSGNKKEKGDASRTIEGYTDTVLSMGFLTPLLIIAKGDEAILPKGTEVDALVASDVSFDPALLRQHMAALEDAAAKARSTAAAAAYFYLKERLPGQDHIALLDGKKVVKLRAAHYYRIELPPGNHTIKCQQTELPLEMKVGESYYIRMVQQGGIRKHCAPVQIDSELGEEEVYPLLAADHKDVFAR
jgi:hypothetical protein